MVRKYNRTLIAYNINGHVSPGNLNENVLDYNEFFNRLYHSPNEERIYEVRGSVVAITKSLSLEGGRLAFLFVSGSDAESVLTLDLETAATSEVKARENNIFVQSRWVIVDSMSRTVIMENKRPTVSKLDIEYMLELYAERNLGLETVELSITEKPSDSFVEQILAMERIREASITLNRPNTSWKEDADELIDEITESSAASVEIVARASRKQSLSKSDGIVNSIIHYGEKDISSLKNARVIGRMPDSSVDTSVSLEKNSLKTSAKISVGSAPLSQINQMASAISFLFNLANRNNNHIARK